MVLVLQGFLQASSHLNLILSALAQRPQLPDWTSQIKALQSLVMGHLAPDRNLQQS